MYIKNEKLECVEGKCYVLRCDLKCVNGVFTAGSRVRIERLHSSEDESHYTYTIKSADNSDKFYLDKRAALDKWIEAMLVEDEKSSLEYQEALDTYEQSWQLAVQRCNAKSKWLWMLFGIVCVISLCDFIITALVGMALHAMLALGGCALAMVLVGVLMGISDDAFWKIIHKLECSMQKKCQAILAA